VSAKASRGFDNLGGPEDIDFAFAEFAAVQWGVDKLLIGVPINARR
jgi:hypothetical protein